MVSCDFYCINKWGGCWCLLSVTKNFYLFGRKHCYELMNLKRHLLIVNTVLCKKQKWKKKKSTRPFSFIWIASVNWILSRHHFCWWNKDISLCIVNQLILTLESLSQSLVAWGWSWLGVAWRWLTLSGVCGLQQDLHSWSHFGFTWCLWCGDLVIFHLIGNSRRCFMVEMK